MEMLGLNPTTPFGRRPLSLGVVTTQKAVKDCPPGKPVHKWQVFRSICEAKARIGVSDRALAVLNALLSFHPDAVLATGAVDLVVFPSNRQLILRAHGIAASTLRRTIAALVDSGLILRRDSPNGKRYARKGIDGAIEQAFGFDLGPIVARAEEFSALADAVRADRRALEMARQQVSLLRRDITKMIATGATEGIAADWPTFHRGFAEILDRLPPRPDRASLEPIIEALAKLAAELLSLLECHVKSAETGAAESRFERQIQNSNTETSSESEPGFRESRAEPPVPPPQRAGSAEAIFPLRMVLEACPDFVGYARHGISNWRDFVATAALVRSILGISPSAWSEACGVLGEVQASAVLAAILQRGSAIKSPGGYLRGLTCKAERGSFSIGPMLMALESAARRPKSSTTFTT